MSHLSLYRCRESRIASIAPKEAGGQPGVDTGTGSPEKPTTIAAKTTAFQGLKRTTSV
jgi:hypothetical protein